MLVALHDGPGIVQAVQKGGSGADHHQRVHVRVQLDQILGAVDEKVAAADQHRDGEDQLDQREV